MKNKFESFTGVYDVNSKNLDGEEIAVLFVSFDLVNSSKFKTINFANWFAVLHVILREVRSMMFGRIKGTEIWRTIGDEIVFVLTITDLNELKRSIQEIFVILNELNGMIKSGFIFADEKNFSEELIDHLKEQNILGIKAAAWIAPVQKIDFSNQDLSKVKRNITYLVPNAGKVPLKEFQGNDIDTGFRVAKENTRNRRLALSLELAYILSKDNSVNPKLHIISYNKLKGIWDERIYPVIWYHDEYVAECSLDKSFVYDEDENDILIEEYLLRAESKKIRHKGNGSAKLKLEKIILDRNLEDKVKKIELIIKSSGSKNKGLIDAYDSNNMLEIHCVAVCYKKETNEILMFKRKQEDDKYSMLWDFGCSKMSRGISFKEQLKKSYKNFANIEISVLDPFKEYTFEKNTELITGIRFLAEIDNDSEIAIADKYIDYKYMTLEKFEKLSYEEKNDYIDYSEFLEVIKFVFNRFINKENPCND